MVFFLVGSSVCYGDLGCFTTDPPFLSLQRPINFLPESPTKINIRFLLYTRENHDDVHFINVEDNTDLSRSHFSGSYPTKIVSHGFMEGGFTSWMKVDSRSHTPDSKSYLCAFFKCDSHCGKLF